MISLLTALPHFDEDGRYDTKHSKNDHLGSKGQNKATSPLTTLQIFDVCIFHVFSECATLPILQYSLLAIGP